MTEQERPKVNSRAQKELDQAEKQFEKFDSEKFNALSDKMKAWLSKSPEYRKVAGQPEKPAEEFYNDDVPF